MDLKNQLRIVLPLITISDYCADPELSKRIIYLVLGWEWDTLKWSITEKI